MKSHHSKIISDKELESIPALKEYTELYKKAIAIGSNKTFEDCDRRISKANEVLERWMQSAMKSKKIDSAKEIVNLMGVINLAELVFFKAYTYEAMRHSFESKLIEKDKIIFEMSNKIEELKKEVNKFAKINKF